MTSKILQELKLLGIRRNLSLEQVSNDFDVTYETMRRYEKGQINITLELLEKFLNYYDVKYDIFFKQVCENMHENL